MKSILTRFALLAVVLSVFTVVDGGQSYANSCLEPRQQRKAINTGKARPFGAIAAKMPGELVHARLCRRGGGLVYIVTVLRGNRRIDAIFDAKSGRRLR